MADLFSQRLKKGTFLFAKCSLFTLISFLFISATYVERLKMEDMIFLLSLADYLTVCALDSFSITAGKCLRVILETLFSISCIIPLAVIIEQSLRPLQIYSWRSQLRPLLVLASYGASSWLLLHLQSEELLTVPIFVYNPKRNQVAKEYITGLFFKAWGLFYAESAYGEVR